MPFRSEDIAYFAVLFEGEGTVRTDRFYWDRNHNKKIRKTPQIKLRIAMTDYEPLLKLKLTLGGRINGPYQSILFSLPGFVSNPNKKGNKLIENYKKYWTFDIDSPKLLKSIVPLIRPYLSPRRQKQLQEV
jgi:hypothetical protein